MLDVDGHIFGNATPVAFIDRCAALIADRASSGYYELIRQIVALGQARVLGISDAAGDPFTHLPCAQSALETLSNEISAAASVSAEEWRALYEAGVELSDSGMSADPALLAASILNLARYAQAENETLTLYLITAGSPVEIAEETSSATICAGLSICVMGNFEEWAGQLALTNNRKLIGLSPHTANACRAFQAATLKRFAKIRDLDDIESVLEEQFAQKQALGRFTRKDQTQNKPILG
ncbi:hypothetical protein KUV57_13425 [Epibacterium sp. DP7N7-1]|nr:hypothetical protein [Epibacterium sp. DP7N7-1]